jgi:ABC-type lipoprotein export system ATPase subunit
VFQFFHLLDDLSVLDNVVLRLSGLPLLPDTLESLPRVLKATEGGL